MTKNKSLKTKTQHAIDKMRVESAVVLQQFTAKIFPKQNVYDRDKVKQETRKIIDE